MHQLKMRECIRAVAHVLGITLAIGSLPAAHAQDIVGEYRYLCERVGGIIDEDNECIDPIIVQGDDDVIPLSDVELPTLQRMASPGRGLAGQVQIQAPVEGQILQPSPSVPGFGTDFSVTQEQGLRMCFNQLEYEVRTCHYAFPRDIQAHNECVQAAGDTYQGCLRWVQTLPYEEIQQ